jgi:DNA invertase Pin-like site-specific DNA recombinase
MADAAERRFEVVLVYHTSRFARNQSEARRYKALLRDRLGIRVVSVTQPIGDDPSDPSFFLAESIHEMFDEYYSVSLSFWTRTGLREKARQGHLVGSLPWGYVRDRDSGVAVPDTDRAELVRELFERYTTGHESDRSLAEWLNARGARTAKARAFGKDTVREMLVNAAYCGYVCGLRSKDRSVRGLHEPLVSEELFDRVQEIRAWRTRVLKPGKPSEEYLLRKLLYCERCAHACTAREDRAPASAATSARPVATPKAAANQSLRQNRSRRSSSNGCTTSSPTNRCARTSSTSSAPKRSASATTTPVAAASCMDSSTGSATSTSLGT